MGRAGFEPATLGLKVPTFDYFRFGLNRRSSGLSVGLPAHSSRIGSRRPFTTHLCVAAAEVNLVSALPAFLDERLDCLPGASFSFFSAAPFGDRLGRLVV
jgi:hypothetical protein